MQSIAEQLSLANERMGEMSLSSCFGDGFRFFFDVLIFRSGIAVVKLLGPSHIRRVVFYNF